MDTHELYIHKTPIPSPTLLTKVELGDGIVRTISNNGAIWSSARVVRCCLKWQNERNPCRLLLCQTRLPGFNLEEGGDDVKSACLLRLGLHTCYNGIQQRDAKSQDGANPDKLSLSSD